MSDNGSVFQLARLLEARGQSLVLAESCTGGRVAAELTRVSGISRFFCGSVVTYQDSFKSEWLGISESLIGEQTSVSSAVTEIMATQVLAKSAFASISAAVTGHLGPDVEPAVDGILFVAIAIKSGSEIKLVECEPFRLSTVSRCERQTEATEMVLQQLVRYLKDDRRST